MSHRPTSTSPRRTAKRAACIVAAILAAAGLAAVVQAFWSSPGTGTGSASVGDTQPLTFGAGAPSTPLRPGGQASVAVVVSNPNLVAVRIGALALAADQGTGGFSVDAAHAGCDLSTLAFTTQTNDASGWSVPPRVDATDGSLSLDLVGALAMSADAASACQGAAITVHLTAVSP